MMNSNPGSLARVDIPNLPDDKISTSDADVNMRNNTMNDEQQPGESIVDIPNLHAEISSNDAGVMRNDTMNDEQQPRESIMDTHDDDDDYDDYDGGGGSDTDGWHSTMDDEQVAGVETPDRYRNRMVPEPIEQLGPYSFNLDMRMKEELYSSRQENSKNKYRIESSYEYDSLPMHVFYHKNLKVVHDAYISITDDVPTNIMNDPTHEHYIFDRRTPMGNTVLHVAAMYGNDYEVEKITQCYQKLLTVKNVNGDTAVHLAAKAGQIEILKKLLAALLSDFNFPLRGNDKKKAIKRIFTVNNKGNTFLHEAILNRHYNVVNFALYDKNHSYAHDDSDFKNFVAKTAITYRNKENKSILYLAIEAGHKELINQALDHAHPDWIPPGKSFFLAAILKQDQGILETILTKKLDWIHSTDGEGRTLLHYAASTGYIGGVKYLLGKEYSLASATDKSGFLPVHLASYGGHVEIVQMLLEDKQICPYPREMLDYNGRNILHLAIQSGKFNVVKYILQSTYQEFQQMVNEKDFNGNTPLHLATFHCHPKIVHALTWEKRVKLNSTNNEDQTAIDLCRDLKKQSFRQRLTWVALKSAGAKFSRELDPCYVKAPPENTESYWDKEAPSIKHYNDRINNLILVSILIVTVTFAAGFTLPGGTDSSDKGKGKAFMLYHTLFKIYILCITVSMYGALGVTITLIWAQLGDLTLAIFALKVVRPILGVTLATLSVAFMAGLHLVISDLKRLATITVALCVIFIITLLLLYTLLWFPSYSGNIVVRYISYYPFLFLASLVDRDKTIGISRPENSGDSVPQP